MTCLQSRSVRSAPLPAAACLVAGLAACEGPASTADRAELGNIAPWNVVPRSSPSQLVTGFRRFCVEAPGDPAAREEMLRDAGYVPTTRRRPGRGQVFLVDDRRPAIVRGARMCIAEARARTGQAEAVRDYVEATFPAARPAAAAPFGRGTELAWTMDGPVPAVVATRRRSDPDGRAVYSVIFFTPG